jgi:hypothetical protein
VYIPLDLYVATNGRLHISPSGTAVVETEGSASNATNFTSLEGATFALSSKGFTALSLQNGWTNAPFSTRNAAYSISNGIVRFEGAIGSGSNLIPFTLPASASPPAEVYVNVDLCGSAKGRLHITSGGAVDIQPFGTMSDATCFTSLEGVSFALGTSGFTALTPLNGWTGAPFYTRKPAVSNASGIVRFQGAVATSGTTTTIFTLPAAFRPTAQVWIPVTLCDSAGGRVVVQTDGTMYVEAETKVTDATCFTSLDGVTFGL